MKEDPLDPERRKHLMRLFPRLDLTRTRPLTGRSEADLGIRAGVLVASSRTLSLALADEIIDIPEIINNAQLMTKAFEGLDTDINFEAAIRVAVMQFISPIEAEVGPKMGLMVRLLEAALCLIDWSVVAARLNETTP